MRRNEDEAKKPKQAATSKNSGSSERGFSDLSRRRLGEFVRLAETVAHSFNTRLLSFEERRQAALIGIAHGLETYQEGRASECTWLNIKARYAVQDAIRQEQKRLRKDPTAKQFQHEDELISLVPDENDGENCRNSAECARLSGLLQKALLKLDLRTRSIVVAVNLHGETQKEVAERHRISQSWASRLYKNGLKKMRNYLVSQEGLDETDFNGVF